MASEPFILASRSPRRVDLLREAGYQFEAVPADIDEEVFPPSLAGDPVRVAEFLARGKAEAIATRHRSAVILAADTVVAVGTLLLGKPDDNDHARWMLQQLTGSPHIVVTGVCVLRASFGHTAIDHAISTVAMRPLHPAELEAYLASGDWQGKAGGYAIQDQDTVVTRIDGSLTNIVGLPMELVVPMLHAAGIRPLQPERPATRA